MLDRIYELMAAKCISEAELTRELKLGRGIFTQWKNGKAKPSRATIMKIAEYFGVSAEWIMTGEERGDELLQMFINAMAIINKLINSISADKANTLMVNFRDCQSYIENLLVKAAVLGITEDYLQRYTLDDVDDFISKVEDAELGLEESRKRSSYKSKYEQDLLMIFRKLPLEKQAEALEILRVLTPKDEPKTPAESDIQAIS